MTSAASSGTSRIANRSDSSCTADVGSPPDQKKASRRSFSSCFGMVSIPAETGVTSFSGSSPAAVSSRSATSRTPEPRCPTPTRLPRRSETLRTSESRGTTSWM